MKLFPLLGLVALSCGQPESVTEVHFAVDMAPAVAAGIFEPGEASVGVRGSVSPLSWGRSTLLEDRDGDLLYEGRVRVANSSDPLRYKFKIEPEDPDQGWESGRDRLVSRLGGSVAVRRVFDDPPPETEIRITGDVRHHAQLGSPGLRYARDAWVYLPPGYEPHDGPRYPVLYLQDGQNVFDATIAGFEWGMDEAAEALIAEGAIEPVIIVAVASTAGRMQEYVLGDTARSYVRFLAEELKPMIDSTYATASERTYVGGSSLGGLISLLAVLEYPEVFSGVLAVSPSVWWDEQRILQLIEQAGTWDARTWIDVGLEEGDGMVSGARALRDALARQTTEPSRLHYVEEPGAGHNELAWAARVPRMLQFLVGTRRGL